jgi:hypothetical protein
MRNFLLTLVIFTTTQLAFSQDFEWVRNGTYKFPAFGKLLATDNAQNIYVAGRFNDSLYLDHITLISPYLTPGDFLVRSYFIAKYTPIGELIWAFAFGPSIINSFVYDENSNSFYIAGDLSGTVIWGEDTLKNFSYWDGFLTRMDTAGNFFWGRKVTGMSSQIAVRPL